jgi:hypothetical protein
LTSRLLEVIRSPDMDTFSQQELDYLAGQRLGRLDADDAA